MIRTLLRPHTVLAAALASVCLAPLAHAQPAGTCSARSAQHVKPVVELYTSEGCSSCPPADRWLSRLPASEVVALAFHVAYWDHLGWKDRFGSAEHTRRQAEQQAVNGARYSYTPQVVIDGMDRMDWPRASIPAARALATVELSLARQGEQISASVRPAPGAPAMLAAYWTVTESNHGTAVRAGENAGAALRHDHVVRELQAVDAWPAKAGAPVMLQFSPRSAAAAAHPRRVNLVIVNAGTGRPVQALSLDC